MINDFSNGRLDEIQAFATTHGLSESYTKTYDRLERYSNEGDEVKLYSDFAPLSLYFEIFREGRFILAEHFFDGYGNGSAPTFSVCLEAERKAGWSIHT